MKTRIPYQHYDRNMTTVIPSYCALHTCNQLAYLFFFCSPACQLLIDKAINYFYILETQLTVLAK